MIFFLICFLSGAFFLIGSIIDFFARAFFVIALRTDFLIRVFVGSGFVADFLIRVVFLAALFFSAFSLLSRSFIKATCSFFVRYHNSCIRFLLFFSFFKSFLICLSSVFSFSFPGFAFLLIFFFIIASEVFHSIQILHSRQEQFMRFYPMRLELSLAPLFPLLLLAKFVLKLHL